MQPRRACRPASATSARPLPTVALLALPKSPSAASARARQRASAVAATPPLLVRHRSEPVVGVASAVTAIPASSAQPPPPPPPPQRRDVVLRFIASCAALPPAPAPVPPSPSPSQPRRQSLTLTAAKPPSARPAVVAPRSRPTPATAGVVATAIPMAAAPPFARPTAPAPHPPTSQCYACAGCGAALFGAATLRPHARHRHNDDGDDDSDDGTTRLLFGACVAESVALKLVWPDSGGMTLAAVCVACGRRVGVAQRGEADASGAILAEAAALRLVAELPTRRASVSHDAAESSGGRCDWVPQFAASPAAAPPPASRPTERVGDDSTDDESECEGEGDDGGSDDNDDDDEALWRQLRRSRAL